MKKILFIGLFLHSLIANATNPTVIITAPVSILQAGASTTVTFNFSEPVSGFDITKIHPQGDGTLSAFTTVSTSLYTVVFTKTIDAAEASLLVDNNSYSAISDATTGTYNSIGFNPALIYYLERSGIFTNLKDRAAPQPRCLLVGEELVNVADNSPATVLKQRFYVVSKNAFKQVKQTCLVQVQSGQIIRRKVTPSAIESLTFQGAHSHSTLMPKATWLDVANVQGADRPRVRAQDQTRCAPVGGTAATGIGVDYSHCSQNSGDFRIFVDAVRISADDPIVFPGQKNRAHLHIFFGNVSTNFQSTNVSLLNARAAVAGGAINKTAYWQPAMIDTTTGVAMLVKGAGFYYKTRDAMGYAENIPQGLKGIAGNPSAANQADLIDTTSFSCLRRNGLSAAEIAANQDGLNAPAGMTGSIPACSGRYYDQLRSEVVFANCLADDGTGKIKLDSPNHRDHWQRGGGIAPFYANGCGAGFPHKIAHITQVVGYPIAPNQDTRTWRLSSDNYSSAIPGGFSLHADYWGMWQQYWFSRMVRDCGNMPIDCGENPIGLNDGIGIASITTSGTTATVTTSVPHQLYQGIPHDYTLKVRISGVTGADANLYNFVAAQVTPIISQTTGYGGIVPAGAMLPIGQVPVTVINPTQFTFILPSVPSVAGQTKTGADLTSGTNYLGTPGALVQWNEILCATDDNEYFCPSSYNEYYYGNKQ